MSEKEIECIKIRFNHYSCVKSTINLILFRVFKSKRINKSNFQIEKCYVPDNKTLFNLYRPYFEIGSDIHGEYRDYMSNKKMNEERNYILKYYKDFIPKKRFGEITVNDKYLDTNDKLEIIKDWIKILYNLELPVQDLYEQFKQKEIEMINDFYARQNELPASAIRSKPNWGHTLDNFVSKLSESLGNYKAE